MPKFIAMLRVKDGIFFANDWLNCFEKLVDEIVVLDNGSTDGTYELLKAHPKVTDIARTEGYNEGRDKNMMYAMARQRKPDWLIWVDIDEIFEAELTRDDFNKLMSRSHVNKYAFRRFHFIDREHFAGSWFRLNYSSGHDRVMWRENASGYFENFIIDSPNVKGIKGLKINTTFRLKHLGYINKDLVDKKANIYRAIVPDKESTFQEMYMRNEKKIRWSDKRGAMEVVLLNRLLDVLLYSRYPLKAIKKIVKPFTSKFQKRVPPSASLS